MDEDLEYEWEERAAILEYEADMTREDAEDETDRQMRSKYSIQKRGERRTSLGVKDVH